MPSHPDRVRRNQPEVSDAAPLLRVVRQYDISCVIPKQTPGHWETATLHGTGHRWWVSDPAQDRRACPRCAGPSLSGGICVACLRGPDEPSSDTPWGV